MLNIEKDKSPILYKKARLVRDDEMGESLDKFMSDMAVTMYASKGTGLSGPQVNSDLRIMVVDVGYLDYLDYGSKFAKIVNPVLVSKTDTDVKAEEQCLSYPGLAVMVERPYEVTISYQTPYGEKKEDIFRSWLARVMLHEMDHLDGVTLFTRTSQMKRQLYLKKRDKGS